MINLVSFASPRFEDSRTRLLRSARHLGEFTSWSFSATDFRKTEIYKRYPAISRFPRGAGLWLWKPYYILQVLRALNDNDVLIYLDAGVEILASLDPLIYAADANRGMGLFTVHEHLNRNWTKRDCFVLMDCDKPQYTDSEQSMGCVIVMRKSDLAVDMTSRWLHYAQDGRILGEEANTCGLPDYPGFVEHRHDQSILSNLRVHYGLMTLVDPTQWGNPFRQRARPGVDEYPALLNLHRERRPSPRNAVKALLTDRRSFANGARTYLRRLLNSTRADR